MNHQKAIRASIRDTASGGSLIVGSVIALLFTTTLTFANDNQIHWRSLLQEVGLSDEQIALASDLIFTHQKKDVDNLAAIKKLKIDLTATIRDNAVEENSTLKIVDQIGSLEAERQRSHVKLLLGIKKVMNPKQFNKFMAAGMNFDSRGQ